MSQNKFNRANRIREVERWLLEIVTNSADLAGRYWRRASSRAMGLVFNGLERMNELVLG